MIVELIENCMHTDYIIEMLGKGPYIVQKISKSLYKCKVYYIEGRPYLAKNFVIISDRVNWVKEGF